MAGDASDAVRHVGYEVEHCARASLATAWALAAPNLSHQLRATLHRASFEACLLHARNMTEFLIPGLHKAHENDITAADILGHPWTCPGGSDRDLLAANLDEIDKHLAHLTWTRVDNPPTGRNHHALTSAVVRLTRRFVDDAHSEEAPWADALEEHVVTAEGEHARLDEAVAQSYTFASATTTSQTVMIASGGTILIDGQTWKARS